MARWNSSPSKVHLLWELLVAASQVNLTRWQKKSNQPYTKRRVSGTSLPPRFHFFFSIKLLQSTQWLWDSCLHVLCVLTLLFCANPLPWLLSALMPVSRLSLSFLSTWILNECLIAKRYTDDHEWISVEDGVGTIGITDYAQKVRNGHAMLKCGVKSSCIPSWMIIGSWWCCLCWISCCWQDYRDQG